MRLREKTRAPGRYREEDDDQNWNDPKPIFVCPTITYNPTLPEAAFPTIPLGEYPPLQPTETPASDKDMIMEGDQANPSQALLVRRWPVNRLTHPQMFKKPPRWEAVGQPGEFTFGAVHDYDEDQNASQHMERHPNIIGYYDDGTRDLEEEYNGWYAKAFEQPDGTTEDRFRMKTYGKQFEWHDLSDAMKLILVRELLRFMPLRKISDYLQWTRDDDRYFVELYNKGARSRQREEDVIAYFNERQTRLLMSGKLDLQKDWNAIFEQEVRQLRGGGAVFSIGQQDLVPVTHLLSALKTREEFPQDWKDRENILTKQELNVIARRLYGYLEFQTSFSDLGFQHEDMFDEIDALDNMPAQRGAEDGDTTDDDEDIPAEGPRRRANSGWTRPPPPRPAASSPLGAEQPDGSRKTVRHIKPYRPSGMSSKIVTLKGMQPTALRQVLNADEVDETKPPVRDNNQCRASINTDEPGIIIRNAEKNAAYQSSNTTVETSPVTKRVPKPSQKAAENGGLPGLPQSQPPQSQKISSAGSAQEVTPSRRVNIRLIVTPTKHADQPQKKSESKSAIANEATKSNSNKLESFGKPLKSISEEPSKQNINHSGASGFVPRGNAQQHHKPALGLHTASQHPPGDITRFRRPEDVPQDLTVVIPNNKRPSTATVPGSQVAQSSTSTSPTRSILNSAVNYGLPTKEDAALPGTTSTTNPHSEGKTLKVGTSQIPQPMPSLLPSLYAAMHNSILNTPFIPIMSNTTAAQGQLPQAQSAQSNKYHNRVRDFAVLVKTKVDPKQKPIPAPQGIRQSQEGQSTPLQFSPATVTKNGFGASLNASITQNQDVISRHKSSSDHRTSGAAISQNFSSMAPPFSMVSNLPQYSVPNHSKLPDPFFTQSPIFPRPGVSGFPHPGTFVNQLPSNSPFDVLSQSPMPIAQVGDMDTLRLQTTTPTNPSLSQQSTETSNDLIDPALLSNVPLNTEQHLLERQHESRIGTSAPAELMIPNLPPNAVPVRHARATSSKQSVMHQPATVQPTVPNLNIAKPNVNASSKVDESIQAPKSGLKVASGKKQVLGPLETKDTTSSLPQSIISEAGATIPAVGRGKPSINSTVPAPNNEPSSTQIQSAPSLKSAIQLITTKPPTESNGDNSISQPLDADALAELSTDTIRSASTKGKEPDVGSDKVTIGGGKSKKTNPKIPDAGLSDVLLAIHAEATSQSNSLNVGVTKSIAEAKYATMEDLELPPSALNAGPSASQSQSGDSQLKKKQVGVGHSKANNTNKRGIEPLDPIAKAAKPPTKKPKKTPLAKPAQPKKNEAAAKPAAKPESSKPEVPVPNNPFSGTSVAPLSRSNTGSAAGMEGVTIQAQVKTPSRTATMKTTPTPRLSPEAAFFTPPENRSPQRSPPKVAFNLDRVMTDDESPTRKRKGKGPMIPTMVDGAGPPATLSSKKNENKKAQNSAVMLETGATSATETKGPATKSSEEVIEEDAAIKPPPVPKSIKAPKHIATRKLPVPKPKGKKTLLTKADAARPTGPSLLEQIEAQEAAQSAEEAAQKVLGAPPPILEQRSRSAAKTAKDARGSAPASPVKSEGKKKTTTGSGKLDALLGNLETGSAGSQKGGKGGAAPEKAHATRSMPTIDGFLKGKEKPSSDGGSVDELASRQEGMVGTGRRPMTRSEDVATDSSRQPTAVIEAGSISGTTPQVITRKRGSTGLLGDVPRPAKRQRTASISASVSAEPTPKPTPTIQAGASAIRPPPKPKASPKPKAPAKAKTPSTRSATPVSTASRAPTPKSTPVGKATTKKAPAKPKAPTPSTNGSSKAPAKKAATPAVKTPTVRPATKKKIPAAKAAPSRKTTAKGK